MTPLVVDANVPACVQSCDASPKRVALPRVFIVTYSISVRPVTTGARFPPAQIPLVLLERPPVALFCLVKSPKSKEFPVDCIVMYCIILILVGNVSPPINTPRVDDAQLPNSDVF